MNADTSTGPGAGRGFPGGFTKIEVAVILGIIGGLIALVAPAVQRARNAALASQTT